jgi:hypothetical protein
MLHGRVVVSLDSVAVQVPDLLSRRFIFKFVADSTQVITGWVTAQQIVTEFYTDQLWELVMLLLLLLLLVMI